MMLKVVLPAVLRRHFVVHLLSLPHVVSSLLPERFGSFTEPFFLSLVYKSSIGQQLFAVLKQCFAVWT